MNARSHGRRFENRCLAPVERGPAGCRQRRAACRPARSSLRPGRLRRPVVTLRRDAASRPTSRRRAAIQPSRAARWRRWRVVL